MADVNVKEAAVLRQYASMLQRFGESSQGNCRDIQNRVERELSSLDRTRKELEQLLMPVEHNVNRVVDRYERARAEVEGINYALIGSSDEDAKMQLQLLKQKNSEISDTIKSMQSKILSITDRAKGYGNQIAHITQTGSELLRRQADFIEQYKDAKKG